MCCVQFRQHEVAAAWLMVGRLQQDIACSWCVLLQACADGVRFLDERKAGMVVLLDRTVRDASLQLKVAALPDRTPMLPCYPCLLNFIPWFHDYASPCTMQLELESLGLHECSRHVPSLSASASQWLHLNVMLPYLLPWV